MKLPGLHKALAVLTLALCGFAAYAAPSRSWEPLKSEPVNLKSVAKEPEVEVKVSPGTLVVVSNRQVQVKVFTILGQLVSSETIGPGVARFQVNAHGVYIVKIGDLTCKVAL